MLFVMHSGSSRPTPAHLGQRALVGALALLIAACSTATTDGDERALRIVAAEVDSTRQVTDTTTTTMAGVVSDHLIDIERAGSPGRVTALPPLGAVLGQGEPIVEVDGLPVGIVMLGSASVTRVLGAGVSDGADVRQLEQNLTELGYATDADLTVDDHWNDATTAAVIDWQHSLGVDETGVVELDDVVVLGTEPTVVDHPVEVGDLATGAILVTATADERVTFEITPAAVDTDAP